MKTAILTGGTGFLGYWVLKELVRNNIFVYVLVRPNSKRRQRLDGIFGIQIIELGMDKICELERYIDKADAFYHLAWEGERDDFTAQMKNITTSVKAMQVANRLGVKKFISTGSQAEYGIYNEKVDENYPTNPNTAYGACKVACYNILKALSEQSGVSLTWVRVFSVYGEGDNPNTLISYLFKCFRENTVPKLTAGNQLWDFLYAEDAAKALYMLGEIRESGVYNLASGESHPLKEFIIEVRDLMNKGLNLDFDVRLLPNEVQLIANVDKIKNEVGWMPEVAFNDGISKFKDLKY